jgi:hypothetical protein
MDELRPGHLQGVEKTRFLRRVRADGGRAVGQNPRQPGKRPLPVGRQKAEEERQEGARPGLAAPRGGLLRFPGTGSKR